ncbi:single-stranded DNA-binding protein [Corynebacterium sp. YIM 101645]|uniref:Single-stranded DNA-binding protein n=1 Tax=Corynebacterium lemuris TaxID=1859292 RepID=A0ABT2G0S7_9CORY|nr:single-stranded DNA-binding protein [Corynebacterium lemuris]MCS5479794.1 single-stranded DNA-binding protein [Corynebacterium lemuris]
MAIGDTSITVVGNVVADPELRFTPQGLAVANFRVASTPRVRDKNSNGWVDGEALFLTCRIWRDAAENVAESLSKGMRVIVNGYLKQRSYQTKDGEQRTVYEVEVEEVGPSLKFAQAHVTRNVRQNGPGGGQAAPQNHSGGFGQAQPSTPRNDPWNSAPPAQGPADDEQPPF